MLFVEEFGNERKDGMDRTIDLYRSVTKTTRERGIPWMFWEIDLRKDGNTWGIMSDDAVWSQVVAPEARKISEIETSDPWLRR